MHAIKIVGRIFDDAPVRIHARRLQALWAAVQSLMEGGRLTLTALGRSMPSQARVKHSIKRVDRLLGNRLLHAQRVDLYRPVVSAVIGKKKRPVLLVDWSGVSDDGYYHTLRACVAMNGRALSVYEEVHSLAQLGNRQVERNFLKVLKDLLPLDCCPIVVTDAGFRVPWCKQVQALGWDWITRIRSRTMFQQQNQGPFERCKTLWTQATTRARCIEQVTVAKSNPIACRLCLVRGKKTGRVNRNKLGQPKRNHHSKLHHKAGQEPWVLATSLERTPPQTRSCASTSCACKSSKAFATSRAPALASPWSCTRPAAKAPPNPAAHLHPGYPRPVAARSCRPAAKSAAPLSSQHRAQPTCAVRPLPWQDAASTSPALHFSPKQTPPDPRRRHPGALVICGDPSGTVPFFKGLIGARLAGLAGW